MILSASEFKAESGFLGTVRSHPTVPVVTDASRAASFMRRAEDRLGQLPLLTSIAVKYGIVYDAAHDIGEGLLAAYGSRTANGPGQHEALGRLLRAVLDRPPTDKAASAFDRMRRARNQDRSEACQATC